MFECINKIKELHLPDGEYLVSGSGILEVLGIRKSKDIDLLVSRKLFNKFIDEGWLRHQKYPTSIVHPQDLAEAKFILDFTKEKFILSDLLPQATIVDGVPFMSLENLLNIKQQLMRDKDKEDIDLIKEYLLK